MKVTITLTDSSDGTRATSRAEKSGCEDNEDSTALSLSHVVFAVLKIVRSASRGDDRAASLINQIADYPEQDSDDRPAHSMLN